MNRREVLKKMGLSAGALAMTPTMMSLVQSCQAKAETWKPNLFTEEQGLFIKKLIDTFLPGTESLPSALELNVHVFIDKYFNQVLPLKERDVNVDIIDMSIKALLSSAEAEEMEQVTTDDIEKFLDQTLKVSKEKEDIFFKRTGEVLDQDIEFLKNLESADRVFLILYGLRELSIWSYKISERVGENILAYKPVPGEQKGCADLQETTGGKAWSL